MSIFALCLTWDSFLIWKFLCLRISKIFRCWCLEVAALPGAVAHAFNLSTWGERGRWISEFESSLVYKVSRTAKAVLLCYAKKPCLEKKKSGAEETAHALIVLSVGLVPTTIWWSTAEAPVSSLLMGCCTGAAHMNSGRHIQPVNVKNSVGKKVLAVCPAALHLSKVRLPSKQVKCGPGTFNTFKGVSEVKSTCCSCRRPGSVLSTQTVTLN